MSLSRKPSETRLADLTVPQLPSAPFLPCPISHHGFKCKAGNVAPSRWGLGGRPRRGFAPLTALRVGGGRGRVTGALTHLAALWEPGERDLANPRSGLSCQDHFSLHCGFHYFSIPRLFWKLAAMGTESLKAPAPFPSCPPTPNPPPLPSPIPS